MNTPTPIWGAGIPGAAAELLPAPAGGPLFSPPKTPPPGSPALSQAAARPTGGERRETAGASRGKRFGPLPIARRLSHGRGTPPGTPRGATPLPRAHRQKSARRGCPERRSPLGKVTPRRQPPRPRHRRAGRCLAAPRRPGEAPRGAAGGRRKTAWRPQRTAGGLRYRTAAPTGHPGRRRGRSGRRGHRSGAAIRGAQQAAEFGGSRRDDPAVSGAGHGADEGEATHPNHLPGLRGSAVRMLPPGAAREPAPLPAGSSAPLAPSAAAAAARDRAPRAPPPARPRRGRAPLPPRRQPSPAQPSPAQPSPPRRRHLPPAGSPGLRCAGPPLPRWAPRRGEALLPAESRSALPRPALRCRPPCPPSRPAAGGQGPPRPGVGGGGRGAARWGGRGRGRGPGRALWRRRRKEPDWQLGGRSPPYSAGRRGRGCSPTVPWGGPLCPRPLPPLLTPARRAGQTRDGGGGPRRCEERRTGFRTEPSSLPAGPLGGSG
ncbi:basic salivary proline-rich protein 1-like [Chamaea fasciata]|uniref:basic salivary proline-rich protein 1-like n=1 Tax=Chamaea fasciata TaxID=190680 RepID=UPI003369D1D2